MAQKNKNIIRVSVSEASKLLGLDQKTIRRGIQNQEFRYIVVFGRYKINLESLIRWSQSNIRLKNKLDSKGIGQFIQKWKIKTKLYSPNPKTIKQKNEE